MPIPASIFKAYDIRGLSPEEVDAGVAYRLGQAMVKFTDAKVVTIGRDMRDTSEALYRAVAEGAMSQGADVIGIGRVSTPILYYAVGSGPTDGAGVMVTASHNPKEYNGFKLCHGDVMPIGGNSGMDVIRDMVLAGPYKEVENRGSFSEVDVVDKYYERLLEEVDVREVGSLKVVVDGGNGMAGETIEKLFAKLPQCEFEGMYLKPDGTFPNHEANPIKEETLHSLKKRVVEVGADLGVAFDGDADRIGFVDEGGEFVRGDLVLAFLAESMSSVVPGTTVMYDVRSSWVVPERIMSSGGKPVMCPVGHGLIKPMMREEDAVFAGELSSHYYFRDFYGAESAELAMLIVMSRMSQTGHSLSQLIDPLLKYHHSGEMNFRVDDADAAMKMLCEKYSKEASVVSCIDGIRMEFRFDKEPELDWWFGVRKSNTEPLLRLNMESKCPTVLSSRMTELVSAIGGERE